MEKQKYQTPVTKGEEYSINIHGMGHSGEGVGRYRDFTVFVPYTLPGEQAAVKITEVKKNYAKAKLVRIIEPAPERMEAQCPIYLDCGGCQLQHMDYRAQLTVKRQKVIDAVERIGHLRGIEVKPVLGAESPWHYRNKMQFPVGLAKGKVQIGCFAQGTHDIVDTDTCLIQHDDNNLIVREMRSIIHELGIPTYNEKDGRGILRHILGRVGTATGEVMVVLVTATEALPQKVRIIEELRRRIPGLVSIVQNINTRQTNVIMGDRTITLWGKDTIIDQLGEFSFEISARSFFQVNTVQAAALYQKAVEYTGLTGSETVIDAYCGTGTISLFLAQKAGKVYGIEIVEPAIKDACSNARRNNISNVEFIVGDAVKVMPQLFKQGIRPQAVVVDPPRAGCDKAVLETFVKMQPARIVYVSCNPSSFARDLAILAELGYETKEIQPVDMFPWTYHVECVALIEREKA